MQNLESFEPALFDLIGEYSENKFSLSEGNNISKIKYKCHRCNKYHIMSDFFKLLPSTYIQYKEHVSRIHSLATVISARCGIRLDLVNLCTTCIIFAYTSSGYLDTGYLSRKSRRYPKKKKTLIKRLNPEIIDTLFETCVKYDLYSLDPIYAITNIKKRYCKKVNILKKVCITFEKNNIDIKKIIKTRYKHFHKLSTLFYISSKIDNDLTEIQNHSQLYNKFLKTEKKRNKFFQK
jgi:hypothetical protein|tara:strand:- start:28 stop:732 length:705 start_codon:yes stop_codon:yes gene_type:complete